MKKLNLSTFSINLDAMAHAIAQEFYQHQSEAKKAKQVYLNTLAVYAVNYYLKCLNIETDLEASDSWDLVMQTLSDVADLEVKKSGKLECRPVLPNSDSCYIPAEVWSDRIGYIAVQFNQDLTEANLLGFISEATIEKFPIKQLQSLDNLIVHLSQPKEQTSAHLHRWMEGIFEPLWEPIEALFAPNLAYNFMTDISSTIHRGKRLNLGMHFQDKQVALSVQLTPKAEITEIQVQLRPVGGDKYLPANVKLALLTQKDRVIQEVKARSSDYLIQLDKFGYRSGRKFRLQVSLDDATITQEIDNLWRFTEDFFV